jgi:hypothetical protein
MACKQTGCLLRACERDSSGKPKPPSQSERYGKCSYCNGLRTAMDGRCKPTDISTAYSLMQTLSRAKSKPSLNKDSEKAPTPLPIHRGIILCTRAPPHCHIRPRRMPKEIVDKGTNLLWRLWICPVSNVSPPVTVHFTAVIWDEFPHHLSRRRQTHLPNVLHPTNFALCCVNFFCPLHNVRPFFFFFCLTRVSRQEIFQTSRAHTHTHTQTKGFAKKKFRVSEFIRER